MQVTVERRSSPGKTPPATIAAIIAVSAVASAFICWLVYFHAPTDVAGTHLLFLPATNAVLNALSTIALLTGFVYIRRREIARHKAAMLTAFFFSSIFLVSYLVNFTLHGETRFPRANPLWNVYWPILASHIVLSTIALPLVLITFFFSLTGRFPQHRKIARWTFPIWLYVSVTGVVVYAMQAACR
ncbi:MAG TPA: DUF420 domain-containing protein [Silvibacterium sp.]|nr:DUF420 domain-containing protein [Silvibacterium sp.]